MTIDSRHKIADLGEYLRRVPSQKLFWGQWLLIMRQFSPQIELLGRFYEPTASVLLGAALKRQSDRGRVGRVVVDVAEGV